MNTKNGKFWYVARPLVLMSIALTSLILMIHTATAKTKTVNESCTSNCKKINADVLNSIAIKLM